MPRRWSHAEFLDRWRVLRAALDNSPRLAPDADTVDFGAAVIALRTGHPVTRRAWISGRYVVRQDGYPCGIPINRNTSRATGLPEGTECAFDPYLMLCLNPGAGPGMTGPDDTMPRFVPWQPTTSDVLAEDWRIVDDVNHHARPDQEQATQQGPTPEQG